MATRKQAPQFGPAMPSSRDVLPHQIMRKLSALREPQAIDLIVDNDRVKVSSKARIRINISGEIYETYCSTLQRYPQTLLGNEELRDKYYDSRRCEYFFNRNRDAFDSILFYYQSSGKLLKPNTITLRDFLDELEFFQMGDDLLGRFKAEIHCSLTSQTLMEYTGPPCLRTVWRFLEQPRSSMGAMAMAFFAVSVIVFSIICFCLETIPSWRQSTKHMEVLEVSEIACVAWFTIELVLRALVTPDKLLFAMTLLNIMDAVSIVPFYVTLVLRLFNADEKFTVLRVMRLLRVLRIFKLSRHLRILNILLNTIQSSAMQLLLLMFFVMIATTLFASAIFYAESSFGSIPAALWWSIITLTNVGYGDLVPVSIMGKLVGSMCAISGLVTLALPIPVIVSSFMYYNDLDKEMAENDGQSQREEGANKKMEMMRNIFGIGKMRSTFAGATRAHGRQHASH